MKWLKARRRCNDDTANGEDKLLTRGIRRPQSTAGLLDEKRGERERERGCEFRGWG